jgi:hypothetical protein
LQQQNITATLAAQQQQQQIGGGSSGSSSGGSSATRSGGGGIRVKTESSRKRKNQPSLSSELQQLHSETATLASRLGQHGVTGVQLLASALSLASEQAQSLENKLDVLSRWSATLVQSLQAANVPVGVRVHVFHTSCMRLAYIFVGVLLRCIRLACLATIKRGSNNSLVVY